MEFDRSRIFENRALKKIFGSKRGEVTGELRKYIICTLHHIPYYFAYRTHILRIFFPVEELRCVFNSTTVHVSDFSQKPTFDYWMRLKFESVVCSK
jgi:hypothetical protein